MTCGCVEGGAPGALLAIGIRHRISTGWIGRGRTAQMLPGLASCRAVCLLQPTDELVVDVLRAGDAYSMREHRVEASGSFESRGRLDAVENDSDVHACCGRRLNHGELLAATQTDV